jgi:hypothetical protein
MCEDKMICERVQRAMRTDSIPEFTDAENEHLAACGTCTELLLTHLLQQKLEIAVPTEWAARVASRLTAEIKTARAHRPIPAYGFTTAVAVLMVMSLAWSVFAYVDPQWWTLQGGLSLVLEGIVTFEIGIIALWLGIRRSAG